MSGVYAYCVLTPGSHPPARLTGLGDAPVRAVEVAGLSVWISDAERAPALDIEAVRLHHRVVCAAVHESVVPFRFGSWAPETAVLEERIRRSSDGLAAALHRVEGRVELGIRVVHPGARAAEQDPDAAPATSGRAYMRALSRGQRERADRRRRQEQIAREASDSLASIPHDTRLTYLPAPDLVSLSHLVARRDEPYYRSRMKAFADALAPGLAVHVTGPWPPYSFVQA